MDFADLEYVKCSYERVQRRINKTVQTFLMSPYYRLTGVNSTLNLIERNEDILSLIWTMQNWIMQLDKMYLANYNYFSSIS